MDVLDIVRRRSRRKVGVVDLAPFAGLRYRPDIPPGAVTAPPYDAIDPGLAARLRRRSPYNVVRLELAGTADGGEDPYARAGRTFADWIGQGVLRRDHQPLLYAYEERYHHGGMVRRQRGLLAALRLEPWEDGAVLPHEEIFRAPVEDRLRLLEALPANVSPVMVLAEAEPPAVAAALDAVGATPPALVFVDDEDGVEHRLWPVADPATHRRVAEDYAGAGVLMADGHHRYTTALEFRSAHPGVDGAGRILAFVAGEDAGPVVRPTHRVLRGVRDDVTGRFERLGFAVVPVDSSADRAGSVVAALAEVETGRVAFGVVGRDGAALVVADDDALDALLTDAVPEPLRRLDAAVLARVLDVALAEAAVAHTTDVIGATDRVRRGADDAVVVLRPVSIPQVRAVAAAGARMPPKTTSFFPKPRTGLVLRPLDGR